MACCAFAVLLLSQLLLPFRKLSERLGWQGVWQPEAAVLWSPHGQASAAPAAKAGPAFTRAASAVLAFEIAFAIAAAAWVGSAATGGRLPSLESRTAEVEAALHRSICGPFRSN